jgi:small GTP-binding protein
MKPGTFAATPSSCRRRARADPLRSERDGERHVLHRLFTQLAGRDGDLFSYHPRRWGLIGRRRRLGPGRRIALREARPGRGERGDNQEEQSPAREAPAGRNPHVRVGTVHRSPPHRRGRRAPMSDGRTSPREVTKPNLRLSSTEVARRRTFAIISHPDAGKTTLTEKLLLHAGAIHQAGAVKARPSSARRSTLSDWMEIERRRGISSPRRCCASSGTAALFNLLDTPGHADFSEDTYRTLWAVDAAVMVVDARQGPGAQTLKLFEVCRLRHLPIVTFINKLDREGRDPFELMDEIERDLQLARHPGQLAGRDGQLVPRLLRPPAPGAAALRPRQGRAPDRADPLRGSRGSGARAHLPAAPSAQLRDEAHLVAALCPPFDETTYREGHLTPVYFGSALHNFGVRELLAGLARSAPSPRPQRTAERSIAPTEERSPASSSRSRRTWTPSTATASPSRASARGASSAA